MHWVLNFGEGKSPCRVNHASAIIGEHVYTFGGYCQQADLKELRRKHPIDVHVLNTGSQHTNRIHHHNNYSIGLLIFYFCLCCCKFKSQIQVDEAAAAGRRPNAVALHALLSLRPHVRHLLGHGLLVGRSRRLDQLAVQPPLLLQSKWVATKKIWTQKLLILVLVLIYVCALVRV